MFNNFRIIKNFFRNANDLGILLAGMPKFDIEDLKANTTYENYEESDNVICWFWDLMRNLKE